MTEMNKVNMEELDEVNGGYFIGQTLRVCRLNSGYLAVRTSPAAERENEIGCLYNGDQVQVVGGTVRGSGFGGMATYILVYVPRLRIQGYVNEYYLG